jgi:tetratricopeptide (TPR) repeat protein
LSGSRRNGRLAIEVRRLDALLAEIAAGHPVLVFQNLGLDLLPQWHFAVAIGYDLPARTIILHSGTEARRSVALATFERTWRRGDFWALTVLKPDQFPVSARQRDVVEAAAGLERAGRLPEAETAYATALARWPENHAALMGLGNTRYARRNVSGAEVAYRRAIELRPDAAAAWNNLAYVLKALGRRSEAISAAQRAVALGGGQTTRYRDSLEDILDRDRRRSSRPAR